MVRTFYRNISSLTLALLLGAAVAAGCSSDTDDPIAPGGNNNTAECLPDPECVGCVADGDCCAFTINCGPGRICNQPIAELYDPDKEEDVCIRVICDTNDDCDPGEVCGRDRLCRPPTCQSNDDCTGGELCLNGTCQAAPDSGEVASCSVSTRDGSVSTGGTITLTAVAVNSAGATLGGITFDWTSSDPNIVSVDGNVATGGATQGTATITARPAGTDLDCDGSAMISNLEGVNAGSARVVVREDGVGGPVADAVVTVITSQGVQTATTSVIGEATFVAAATDIESVTVEKDGWQLFSVISPGVADIFIPLPRNNNVTIAGGIRGVIDQSLIRSADIKFGFAGPAIPSNLLDVGAEELIGDILDTDINSPELGIEDTVAPLPAGLLFSIGTSDFTETPERCQGVTPADTDLGCFLTRMPAGPSAGWALGGQVRLAEITGLVNELSGLLGGGTTDIPFGDILTGVVPLLRFFSHGIDAAVTADQFTKVNAPGQTGNCSDPTLPNYNDVCVADFTQYARNDLQLTQPLNVLASVGVPDLPTAPSGNCASGAVIVTASNLAGRGLIPLGLAAGLSKSMTDCEVAGLAEPFGPGTQDLPDGRMALSMATPHSGLEGSQTLLLLLAVDIDQLIAGAGSGFQVSAILNRVSKVDSTQNVSGAYLPYPEGVVSKQNGSITFSNALGATLTRAEIQQGDRTWLVYAPAGATIALPNVASGQSIVNNATSTVLITIKTRDDVGYGDVWQFASGTTLDRLFDIADSFVVTDCPDDDATASCRLE